MDEVDVRVSHLHTSFLSLSLKYCLGHELLVLKFPMQEFWGRKLCFTAKFLSAKKYSSFVDENFIKGIEILSCSILPRTPRHCSKAETTVTISADRHLT